MFYACIWLLKNRKVRECSCYLLYLPLDETRTCIIGESTPNGQRGWHSYNLVHMYSIGLRDGGDKKRGHGRDKGKGAREVTKEKYVRGGTEKNVRRGTKEEKETKEERGQTQQTKEPC